MTDSEPQATDRLEQQLQRAELMINDLEAELDSVRSAVAAGLEDRVALERDYQSRLRECEQQAELRRLREKEELRQEMAAAHRQDLDTHAGLRRALEALVAIREEEIRRLKESVLLQGVHVCESGAGVRGGRSSSLSAGRVVSPVGSLESAESSWCSGSERHEERESEDGKAESGEVGIGGEPGTRREGHRTGGSGSDQRDNGSASAGAA